MFVEFSDVSEAKQFLEAKTVQFEGTDLEICLK